MKVVIRIECLNEAFSECPADEVGRILVELGTRLIKHGELSDFDGNRLFDTNGNAVGSIALTGKRI